MTETPAGSPPDRPIGPEVDATPAPRPTRTTLRGRFVDCVPLEPAHADDLFAVAGGADRAALWDYMPDGPYTDPAPFRDSIARKAASEDSVFFAIRDKTTGRVAGHAALMRIDAANRVIEVGNIMFGSTLQRTPGATESMALLATHVFDDLGYRRYEWKCNALNEPSRRAAARLGFSFEGIFRQHMIVKSRNRDTAWYAMLDSEWPARRAAFAAWLAPGNFDEAGRQRTPLAPAEAS